MKDKDISKEKAFNGSTVAVTLFRDEYYKLINMPYSIKGFILKLDIFAKLATNFDPKKYTGNLFFDSDEIIRDFIKFNSEERQIIFKIVKNRYDKQQLSNNSDTLSQLTFFSGRPSLKKYVHQLAQMEDALSFMEYNLIQEDELSYTDIQKAIQNISV